MRAAAFHEAGHAVMRMAIGWRAMPVEVWADGSGLTHGSGDVLQLRSQYEVWDLIALGLAGPYAEARITKQSRVSVMLRTGLDDYESAMPAIDWLVEHGYAADRDAAWRRAEGHTQSDLRLHWPAVDAVARALIRQHRIEADELVAIWNRHRGSPL